MGWVWQDFITPQGVHRGYHRQTGATIGWTFTFTRGQPLQTPPGHILPFDSLTYFQPHIPLWRWAVHRFRFDVCQSSLAILFIGIKCLTQYTIKLSILIFMAFALIRCCLFWIELMVHQLGS